MLRVLLNLPCLSPKMNTHTKPYHYGMLLSAMDWNEHFDREVTSHNDRVLSITGGIVELGSSKKKKKKKKNLLRLFRTYGC